MNDSINAFAANFPKASEAQWQALVTKALKGAPADSLTHYTSDGIARGPVFAERPKSTAAVARASAPMLADRPWHNCPLIEAPDLETANRDAIANLEGGASALMISASVLSQIDSAADMGRLLDQVRLDYAPIVLEPGAASLAHVKALQDLPKLEKAAIHYGFDGRVNTPDIAPLFDKISTASSLITIDGRAPHEAGASEAQELAYIGAALIETLRALSAEGIDLDLAVSKMSVMAAVDSDSHLGIIKLRALAGLWAQILPAFDINVSAHPLPLHAVTSSRMMARIDPWSNMLRLTSASFAAICGGASFITTLPFSDAITPGWPDSFAQRVSRNIGLLLMEESYLGHVVDPAHGSFMHETLTAELGEAAWKILQEIETEGGLLASLETGALASKIKKSARARIRDIARAKTKMAGVNNFAQIKGRAVEMRKGTRPQQESTLPPIRLTASFEALRRAAAKAKPSATLLSLSDHAMSAARVQFTQNYLACAGIESAVIHKTNSQFALGEAFKAAPSRLLIVCGSDADYDDLNAETMQTLKSAQPCAVWGCARPKGKLDWMSGLIYGGQDRVAALSEALGLLGVDLGDAL